MADIGPPKHLDPLHHGGLRDLGGNYSKLKVVTHGIHMSHQSDLRSGVSDQTQKTRKGHIGPIYVTVLYTGPSRNQC